MPSGQPPPKIAKLACPKCPRRGRPELARRATTGRNSARSAQMLRSKMCSDAQIDATPSLPVVMYNRERGQVWGAGAHVESSCLRASLSREHDKRHATWTRVHETCARPLVSRPAPPFRKAQRRAATPCRRYPRALWPQRLLYSTSGHPSSTLLALQHPSSTLLAVQASNRTLNPKT